MKRDSRFKPWGFIAMLGVCIAIAGIAAWLTGLNFWVLGAILVAAVLVNGFIASIEDKEWRKKK